MIIYSRLRKQGGQSMLLKILRHLPLTLLTFYKGKKASLSCLRKKTQTRNISISHSKIKLYTLSRMIFIYFSMFSAIICDVL